MKIISRARTTAGIFALLLVLGSALAVAALADGARTSRALNPPGARPAETGPPSGKHFAGRVQFDVLARLLAADRRSAPPDEWLRALAGDGAARVETQAHPLLNQTAPDFSLEDHRGRRWGLRDQLGKGPVVVVFYLGYACHLCVHDLFELNADLERVHHLGAEVVAVSGDPPALTRQRFEQYGAFAFPVLSDPGHAVARMYGAVRPATATGAEEVLHGTFLVDRSGQVTWASRGDTPFRNNRALLYELARREIRLPPAELVSREGTDHETDPRVVRLIGIFVVALGGLAAIAIGSRAPSQQERENRREVDAMLTAITLKNSRLLEESGRRAKARRAAGQFTDEEYRGMEVVIAKARAGNWSGAEKDGYEYRKQHPFVREGH